MDPTSIKFVKLRNGPIELNVGIAGQGPLILCVHGFPELWYSWRHQIFYFAKLGYTIVCEGISRQLPSRTTLPHIRFATSPPTLQP